jgi:hypothetical protein
MENGKLFEHFVVFVILFINVICFFSTLSVLWLYSIGELFEIDLHFSDFCAGL